MKIQFLCPSLINSSICLLLCFRDKCDVIRFAEWEGKYQDFITNNPKMCFKRFSDTLWSHDHLCSRHSDEEAFYDASTDPFTILQIQGADEYKSCFLGYIKSSQQQELSTQISELVMKADVVIQSSPLWEKALKTWTYQKYEYLVKCADYHLGKGDTCPVARA